jgi:hypothetical protein
MESFFALADHYSRTSLHTVAHSALPLAPVQPYVEPRRPIRRIITTLRTMTRQPAIDLRTVHYCAEC